MSPSQKRVLDYIMKNGSITTLQANKELGYTRLSAIIFELRKYYDIQDTFIKVVNRYGEETKVKKYFINSEPKRKILHLNFSNTNLKLK